MNRAFKSTHQPLNFPLNMMVCAMATMMLAVPSVSASDGASKAGERIQSDVAFQAAIRDVSEANDEDETYERLNQIRNLSAGRPDHMISQLLLYYAMSDEKARAGNVVGRVLDHVTVPKQVSVFALIPHLDNPDASVQELTRSLLLGYEDRSATRPPDFSSYRSFIEAKIRTDREPPDSLIRHMYGSDPGAALLAIMRGYQLRDPDEIKLILWAERVIADMFWKRRHGFLGFKEVEPAAVRQLRLLSNHERWWVRMYVAEILRRHPELGQPQILESLRDDGHPLIRETILKAEKKLQDRGDGKMRTDDGAERDR